MRQAIPLAGERHNQPTEPPLFRPSYLYAAAQFAVASELCKRGYEVAFTMGNHPESDLMVLSRSKAAFVVDVKGLYKKTPLVISAKKARDDLYYVWHSCLMSHSRWASSTT